MTVLRDSMEKLAQLGTALPAMPPTLEQPKSLRAQGEPFDVRSIVS